VPEQKEGNCPRSWQAARIVELFRAAKHMPEEVRKMESRAEPWTVAFGLAVPINAGSGKHPRASRGFVKCGWHG